jgi:hypothetical protein
MNKTQVCLRFYVSPDGPFNAPTIEGRLRDEEALAGLLHKTIPARSGKLAKHETDTKEKQQQTSHSLLQCLPSLVFKERLHVLKHGRSFLAVHNMIASF